MSAPFDSILQGGTWFDGTGAPGVVRDVGIRDGDADAVRAGRDGEFEGPARGRTGGRERGLHVGPRDLRHDLRVGCGALRDEDRAVVALPHGGGASRKSR